MVPNLHGGGRASINVARPGWQPAPWRQPPPARGHWHAAPRAGATSGNPVAYGWARGTGAGSPGCGSVLRCPAALAAAAGKRPGSTPLPMARIRTPLAKGRRLTKVRYHDPARRPACCWVLGTSACNIARQMHAHTEFGAGHQHAMPRCAWGRAGLRPAYVCTYHRPTRHCARRHRASPVTVYCVAL